MSYREKTPTVISILVRRLKPGKTFADFEKAHLPPVEVSQTEYGYNGEYFSTPVRVIDAVSVTDPNIIYSIGLSYGTSKDIFADVVSKEKENKLRQDLLADVVDTKEVTKIGFVGGDHNFGGSNPKFSPVPLETVTFEVTAMMRAMLPTPKD